MTQIEFGSREAANIVRDKVEQHLSPVDDRRERIVRLESDTPESVVRRVRNDAFRSRADDTDDAAGMGELSDAERESLKRQHSTFNWQSHGFEAMRVKAALQREGVDTWMDYYEPGEGVQSALSKVRSAKQRGAQTRASIGIEGQRTDRGEVGNTQRRARQAERAQSQQVESAKEPALLNQDTEAIGFLREEQQFEGDVFDIAFSETDTFGRPVGSGSDFETLEERHEQRSGRAQELNEQKHAKVTRDPIKWSQNPAQYDYPGIDTLDPQKKHQSRSERARDVDEQERAPIADSPRQWANDMDSFDLPGVDLPERGSAGTTPAPDAGQSGSQGGSDESGPQIPGFTDDRDRQASLDIGPDPTQARESHMAAEQSDGGLFEDTRDDPGRGVDRGDAQKGRQEALDDMLGMDDSGGPDMGDFLP